MTAPTPAEFFEHYVKPPVEQWRSDPDSEWKAKVAAMALNDMAERYWHYWKDRDRSKVYAATKPREFREALVLHECEDFQLIWDVADAHKHVELDRGNRKVSKSSQAGVQEIAFMDGLWEEVTWDPFIAMAVRLDDGLKRPFNVLVDRVMAMWQRLVV